MNAAQSEVLEHNARLRRLVDEITSSCPFYEPWKGETVRLDELPVIDKRTIAEQRERFELPRSADTVTHESYTSGTTGVPFRCVKTAEEQLALSLALFRHRRKWGLPLRHRSVVLSNRMLAEPHTFAHYAHVIADQRPHMIQGRSSALHALAHYMEERGIRPPESLRFAQNWGEPLQPAHRSAVERVFGVPLVDYYGLEEIWCVAFTGTTGRLEIDEQLVYIEAVDPDTREPVPDGEYGELLVTSYVMRSLPFLRYRTGDIGKLIYDGETGKRVLELMPARVSQIKLPGRKASAAIFRYFDRFFYELSATAGVRQFQIEQQSYTRFRLRFAADPFPVEPIRERFGMMLSRCLDIEVEVDVEIVAEIAPHPESGKFQSFVSLVP